jgi:protein-S-isoprenylcysteine O-methyltransferase Ste14
VVLFGALLAGLVTCGSSSSSKATSSLNSWPKSKLGKGASVIILLIYSQYWTANIQITYISVTSSCNLEKWVNHPSYCLKAVAYWLRCLPLNLGIMSYGPHWATTIFIHIVPVLVSSRKRTQKWLQFMHQWKIKKNEKLNENK